MEKHGLEKSLRRFRMANMGYIFISDFCLEFIQSCGDRNWVRSVAMYLPHTKTHVLAGTVKEVIFPPHFSWRMEGKNPTLFHLCAIVAGYFLNFFYTIPINSGWVMMARKPSILVCFGLCLVTKRPLLSTREW